MKRISLLVPAILIVVATGLHAQDQRGTAQNPITLDDSIAVTANRTPTPLSEIASSITVITKKEIDKSGSAFVTHLLRNVPGVDVVQSGGDGKLTSVFLRGANSHHTLVLLDGIPLNDPSSPNNAADISNLLTSNIERIEILRGPQSVLYGPEAIGGVIQLFTGANTNENKVRVSTEAGSHDSYNLTADISGAIDRLNYSVSANRLKTNGVSAADNFSENDGYENTGLSTRLDYLAASSIRLNFAARYIDSESDLDKTSVVFDDPDYYSGQQEKQFSAGIFHQPPDSKWHQQAQFYFGKIDRATHDNFDSDHPADSEFTETYGRRIGAGLQQSLRFDSRHNLTIGVETERASFSSELFFRSAFGDYADNVGGKNSWSRGIFLFDQIQIKDRLYLTFGGRVDEHKQFGATGTYRLTAAYLFDRSGTRLRGVVGTGYKAPSVYQLYHPSPYFGNPKLKPEKSQSREIGIDQEILTNQLSVSLTYFYNSFDDLIVGIENVAEASSDGCEAAIEFSADRVRTRLDYIYCHSRDKTTDEELIRRPKHSLILKNTIQPSHQLSLNISAKFTGRRFDQDFSQFPASRLELDNFTVVNLGAAFLVRRNLEISGRVDNLFDENYQEIYGYGNMPLSVYAGIRLSN